MTPSCPIPTPQDSNRHKVCIQLINAVFKSKKEKKNPLCIITQFQEVISFRKLLVTVFLIFCHFAKPFSKYR